MRHWNSAVPKTFKKPASILSGAFCAVLLPVLPIVVFHPVPAEATQSHPGLEGLIVHQLAHGFFLFSMGILIYWLRQRGLNRESGWRSVQYAAVLFILWNLNALVVHSLDGLGPVFEQINSGDLHDRVTLSGQGVGFFLPVLYYFLKLDHLLCVPAIVCLYVGLRRLLREAQAGGSVSR